ncbi:hypothetical protein niasHT_028856 [Heterodera trifolii]|uniref:BTB domain-containing protein n=1 Tax=Heterodera trifolii TaxID=157864 RepID=A0ABD2KQW8_9BILA
MSKAAIAVLKLMLSTGEYADVHFLLVPAHKLILKHASDLFEAIFRFDANKELGENANYSVVEVPDVEASAFKVMLSFIYTEHLSELNGDNAMAVLYAAENRRQMLGSALFKIRFPLLSKEDFSEKIVPSGILTTNEVIGVEQYHTNQNLQFSNQERIKAFGTLLMDIEKVSEFAREEVESSRYSEKMYINGLPWRIEAQIETKEGSTDNEKYLGIYLLCDAPNEDSNWRCCVRAATFRIVSQKNEAENSIGEVFDRVCGNKKNWLGIPNFITFAELMEPNNGFYDKSKDKVTLAIDITTSDEQKVF